MGLCHAFQEIFAAFQVVCNTGNAAAIGIDALFGAFNAGLTPQQGCCIMRRQYMRQTHRHQRAQPDHRNRGGDASGHHLHPRRYADESHMPLRPHEKFAVREPSTQPRHQFTKRQKLQERPVFLRPIRAGRHNMQARYQRGAL